MDLQSSRVAFRKSRRKAVGEKMRTVCASHAPGGLDAQLPSLVHKLEV